MGCVTISLELFFDHVNLTKLLAFIAVFAINYFWGNSVVRFFHDMVEDHYLTRYVNQPFVAEVKNRIDISLHLEFGRTIGILERIFYIYAIMSANITIISGIIVFKAFSGWMTPVTSRNSSATNKHSREGEVERLSELGLIYLYVVGSLLSLALGILLGKGGLLFSLWLEDLVSPLSADYLDHMKLYKSCWL
jgi:hypothetical protein